MVRMLDLLAHWRGRYLVASPETHERVKVYCQSLEQLRAIAEKTLQVPTQVPAYSIEDIYRFLRGCRYVRDPELVGMRDHWQTPDEFERRRAGDCEDHALWAWRKFVELGETARLTLGRWNRGAHAWTTIYDIEDRPQVLETTEKTRLRLVDPVVEPEAYRPVFSIDGALRFYQHGAK